MSDSSVKTPATNEDIDKAFDGPAIFVNKFTAMLSQSGVRLSFLEQGYQSGPQMFRTALFLSYGDAIALKNLLNDMLNGIEETIEVSNTK